MKRLSVQVRLEPPIGSITPPTGCSTCGFICDKSYGYSFLNTYKEEYAGLAQLVRASGLHPEGRRFESVTPYHVAVVQLVERLIVAQKVVDSNSTSHPNIKGQLALC